MKKITLYLTPEQEKILQAGVSIQTDLSRPGINFSEVTEDSVKKHRDAIVLRDQVAVAIANGEKVECEGG